MMKINTTTVYNGLVRACNEKHSPRTRRQTNMHLQHWLYLYSGVVVVVVVASPKPKLSTVVVPFIPIHTNLDVCLHFCHIYTNVFIASHSSREKHPFIDVYTYKNPPLYQTGFIFHPYNIWCSFAKLCMYDAFMHKCWHACLYGQLITVTWF